MNHFRDQGDTPPSMEAVAHLVLSTKMEGTTMPSKPNKHELKTQETRSLLLSAAEEVFTRDGFRR